MKITFFKQINEFFPFRNVLKLLLALSFGIQFIIISYNHLSGYYPIYGIASFIWHLLIGTAIMLTASFVISIPDLLIIRYLNRSFPWNKRVLARILIQLCLTVLLAVFVSILVTVFVNWISAYQKGFMPVLITNALISSVVNILMMVVLEAWHFFAESNTERVKAETLQKELSQVRFEVLKSQLNPHFMFNSLNVLSGLIDKDVEKAQLFIDEFAHIYRYVLETIEKSVVSLNEELDFVRSYIFLQQIRYGEALSLTVKIPSHLLGMLLPPLSLQLVLENAVKHNIVNPSLPLRIEISHDSEWLTVKNNIQLKITSNVSTGLGQKNLEKRCAMICDEIPQFQVESNYYIVRLPLIKNDYDERTDS
jgi:sensor histidine kinase YesM